MAFLERNTKNTKNRYWLPEENTFPVSNRYTAGVAGQKFFQELKDNAKIMGTACKPCNTTFVPGRLFCERCFARMEDWFDAGTEGTLFSYTVAYFNKDGSAKAEPVVVAAIKIADGVLVHWLGECEEPVVGMKVAAVFKPAAERKGSMLDIKYFKPV